MGSMNTSEICRYIYSIQIYLYIYNIYFFDIDIYIYVDEYLSRVKIKNPLKPPAPNFDAVSMNECFFFSGSVRYDDTWIYA